MLSGILSNKNREKLSYDWYIYTMDRMSTGQFCFDEIEMIPSTGENFGRPSIQIPNFFSAAGKNFEILEGQQVKILLFLAPQAKIF